MRIAGVLMVAFLLAGCTQGTPGGGEDDFEPSCPSWVKYPHNGQIIEGAMQWTKNSTNPDDLVRWDFMEPTFDAEGNLVKAGQGLGDGLLEYDGHPLDMMELNFHFREKAPGTPSRVLYVQEGELHLRFYANEGGSPGQRLSAYDVTKGKASAKEEWVFASDPARLWSMFNVTLHIDLAQPNEEPAPVGVFAQWELAVRDNDNNADTATAVLMHYAPELWYRTCS